MPFYLAVTQLEHAEWLTAEGRNGEAAPLLDEARSTFGGLGAAPWLAQAEALGAPAHTTA